MKKDLTLNDFEMNENNMFAIKFLKCFTDDLRDRSSIYLCCKNKKYRQDLLVAFVNDVKKLGNRKIKSINSKTIIDDNSIVVNENEIKIWLENIDVLVVNNIEEIEDKKIGQQTLLMIIKICLKTNKQIIISGDREVENFDIDPLLKNKLLYGYRIRIFE